MKFLKSITKSLGEKIKWGSAALSIWTMVFTPVALGQQAQKNAATELQQRINQLGLNRSITVGQFFEKNKDVFPERIRKQLASAIRANANMAMPTVEVTTAKAADGTIVPVLRMASGKELISVQWYGDETRYVKFQNTNLSQVDIINFTDMFQRVVAGDARFNRVLEEKPMTRMNKTFRYPDVSDSEWRTMSLQAKAAYIINLRTLWQEARDVLRIKEQQKNKKTSDFQIRSPRFFDLLISENAEAQTRGRGNTTRRALANSCIVAGYTSQYENGVCSVARVRTQYADRPLFARASELCEAQTPGSIACNPYIYGAPGADGSGTGEPKCIVPSRTNAEFQRATHFDGPCDTGSRLQSSNDEFSFLADASVGRNAKREGRYSEGNIRLGSDQLRQHFEEDHRANAQLTERYILGVLKMRGMTNATQFSAVELSEESLAQIREIKTEFEREINDARTACASVVAGTDAIETNYIQACDQLHRRFLFVDMALERRCQAGNLTYNPESMRCSCPVATGAPTNAQPAAAPQPAPQPAQPPTVAQEVIPGARCPVSGGAVTAVVAPAPVPQPAQPGQPARETCDEVVSNPNCICADNQAPSDRGAIRGGGAVAGLTCDRGGGNPATRSNNNSGGGILSFIGKALPWLLFAGVIVAGTMLLAPQKPALAGPADRCPNGSIPPCPTTCTPPKAPLPTGICGCAACPLGQVSNAECRCGPANVNDSEKSALQLCPDQVNYRRAGEKCPVYFCASDGKSYENPTDCPAETPSADSTRERSGNR